jgi:hypothetical protein
MAKALADRAQPRPVLNTASLMFIARLPLLAGKWPIEDFVPAWPGGTTAFANCPMQP